MISESLVTLPETQRGLRLGLVTRFSHNRVEVVLDGEIVSAVRSSGCTVDPQAGDRVVLYLPENHAPIILSIVEGMGDQGHGPRTMQFPKGLVLEVSGHPFILRSTEGLEIESPKETRVWGGRFVGQFESVEIGAASLTMTGDILSFVGRKIEQVGKTLERVAEWLHDRAHGSNREIDTLDRQTSGETLISSDSIVSIQSKTTLLSSPDLVKVDSDQIHLG